MLGHNGEHSQYRLPGLWYFVRATQTDWDMIVIIIIIVAFKLDLQLFMFFPPS